MRLLAATAAVAALALTFTAPADADQIWSEYASNTAGADVTAVDFVAPDVVWYGTGDGRIFLSGQQRHIDSAAGRITDIAASPDGSKGLATSTGDEKLYRTVDGGINWAPVANISVTRNTLCGGPGALDSFPEGELSAVKWASNTVAYVIGANPAMVLRTTDGGATWAEINKHADASCSTAFDTGRSQRFTGLAVLAIGDVWLIGDDRGRRQHSTSDFISPATPLVADAHSCITESFIAIEPADPTLSLAGAGCGGQQSLQASTDSGQTYHELALRGPTDSAIDGLRDAALAGGSGVIVGNAGDILLTPNPREAYFEPAADPATDWLTVDKLDATRAVIGGRGGRMLISSVANVTTDRVAPTGQIVGPATAVLGRATSYSARVSDDRGVLTNSFQWVGDGPAPTGVNATDGNPATVTFTSPGSKVLKVTFRDAQGNVGTARKRVLVRKARADSTIPPGTRTGNPTRTVSIAGATITLTGPRTCVRPGLAFSPTLITRKRKGARFIAITEARFSIDAQAVVRDTIEPLRRSLTVRGLKPGSKHVLRARMSLKLTGGRTHQRSLQLRFRVCSS